MISDIWQKQSKFEKYGENLLRNLLYDVNMYIYYRSIFDSKLCAQIGFKCTWHELLH